jgi:hypothetical protein
MKKTLKLAVLSCSVMAIAALGNGIAVAAEEHAPPPEHAQEHAQPQQHAQPRPAPVAGRPAYDAHAPVLDSRYNHGRYYPPVGTVRPSLPAEYRPYYRGGRPYYFNGGIWYAPQGSGFVVVRPPVGLVINVLPPYYSTVWFGGVPYYYADNVYYAAQPGQDGYAVVDPPDNSDAPSPPPDPPQADLIVYPKNGQNKEQQAADQYECHNWAKGQTGFDPTQVGDPGSSAVNRSNYSRAMSACLQARGYQVN